MPTPHPYLPWTHLSERERLVWGAVFALSEGEPAQLAKLADTKVMQLRALELDQPRGMNPEYEAARAGFQLTFDEFEPWYRVAWRLRHGHARSFQEPTRSQIRVAYDAFQAGRGDFY